jgi:transcriptional regulator with XRE-family HTH domain
MKSSFGEYFKERRIAKGVTLRAFCLENGFDPGNISRLERGLLGPPHSHEKIEEYARALGIKEGSDEWIEFFDRAAAESGRIPKDLLSDEELVDKLPVLFRTLRGQKVDPKKLEELAETIRRT